MLGYTKDEALAFIDAMRLTLGDKVGFRWLVEKLSLLAAYVGSVASENERLNEYIDQAGLRDDFESYRATHLGGGSRECPADRPPRP